MSTMTINTPDSAMAASIANDFIEQGFAFPDIKRIIFNTGTKTVKPAKKDETGKEIEPALSMSMDLRFQLSTLRLIHSILMRMVVRQSRTRRTALRML